MECESELILTVPRDELGGAAIEFLRYSGGTAYSCRFVESLQDRLAGTEAAKVLDNGPVAYHLFRVPMGSEHDVAEKLRRSFDGKGPQRGRILAAEVNHPMQLAQHPWPDFSLGGQHASYLQMMHVAEAHKNTVTGAKRTIAIIDSGIEPAHAIHTQEMIDAMQNPVQRHAPLMDNDGHGTAMALLAHAVAPNAQIYSVRICDKGNGVSVYGVMAGIFVGAIDCAADVLNLSLGFKAIRKCGVCGASGAVRSFALETAMGIAQQARSGGGQQGFLYVAAAGNDGLSTGLDHPARYACVVPVGSVDSAGNRSDFSNFDRANLHANHIMAPGGQISGSAVTEDVGRWQSTQRQCHGTSGATAYASAMLALLWSDSRYVALDSKAFLAVVKTSHCTLQLGQRTDEHGSGLIHYNPPLLAAGRRADDSASPTSIEYVADGVYVGDVFLSGSQ